MQNDFLTPQLDFVRYLSRAALARLAETAATRRKTNTSTGDPELDAKPLVVIVPLA